MQNEGSGDADNGCAQPTADNQVIEGLGGKGGSKDFGKTTDENSSKETSYIADPDPQKSAFSAASSSFRHSQHSRHSGVLSHTEQLVGSREENNVSNKCYNILPEKKNN